MRISVPRPSGSFSSSFVMTKAVRLGLPNVLLVVVVLGDHLHVVGHQVHRVEAHAELADEAHVTARGHLIKEGGGAGLGDGAQVVHQVRLGHAHALVAD
jgi:hypothetical protein